MCGAIAKDTKDRILDAAELLFADHGFAGTSLRMVTSAAEVNLAAVNYHFGSKEGLVEAVFARRLGPMNRERLRRLDELERRHCDLPVPLEELVLAFVDPPLRMTAHAGATVVRLVGQAMSRPDDQTRRVFAAQFREIVRRFSAAMGRALPRLSDADLLWRMLFMVGAMAHTMALAEELREISGGRCDPDDVDATLDRLVTFVSAGLRAPHVPAGGASA